ncbi:MAG: pyridoxal 5'-phosphate synthase glutaminase subunit PdxT [Patescibacteria group bacterium]|nr:pyridoxal 5'-phosphate synthase glutaminase subunit PdxT [Patescibacteria group bacterium]
MKPMVGLLALQGDFWKHKERLDQMGVSSRLVRSPRELKSCSHLIIPGGESTTLSKLMDSSGLRSAICQFGEKNYVWGTCAGMILLSNDSGDSRVKPLGLIDTVIERNAYGRQVDSFTAPLYFNGLKFNEPFHAIFIRAPKIKSIGPSVTALARHNNSVVMARNDRILITSFHPELSGDVRIHKYFLEEM